MLVIDQEALTDAKNSYSEAASQMKNLRNKLQRATDDIRSGWKSKAGKKFFSKFDDEWLKNFNDYIDVIEHMANNMSIAQSKYQSVFDEADKLNLL